MDTNDIILYWALPQSAEACQHALENNLLAKSTHYQLDGIYTHSFTEIDLGNPSAPSNTSAASDFLITWTNAILSSFPEDNALLIPPKASDITAIPQCLMALLYVFNKKIMENDAFFDTLCRDAPLQEWESAPSSMHKSLFNVLKVQMPQALARSRIFFTDNIAQAVHTGHESEETIDSSSVELSKEFPHDIDDKVVIEFEACKCVTMEQCSHSRFILFPFTNPGGSLEDLARVFCTTLCVTFDQGLLRAMSEYASHSELFDSPKVCCVTIPSSVKGQLLQMKPDQFTRVAERLDERLLDAVLKELWGTSSPKPDSLSSSQGSETGLDPGETSKRHSIVQSSGGATITPTFSGGSSDPRLMFGSVGDSGARSGGPSSTKIPSSPQPQRTKEELEAREKRKAKALQEAKIGNAATEEELDAIRKLLASYAK